MFAPDSYNSTLESLLLGDRCRPLDAGTPDTALAARLKGIALEALFTPQAIVDREAAELCLAALWLLADDLDASHVISQRWETRDGSYWHGIMHRREGDFGNAKYWFRRAGRHEIFPQLHEAAQALATESEPSAAREQILSATEWNPSLFVDLVAAAVRDAAKGAELCRRVAQAEWELLFAATYRKAIGE